MTPPLGGKSEASKTALSGSQPFKPPALPVVPDLGLMYKNGEGVDQDYDKACYLFEAAAEGGNPEAQWFLALMYENGYGVPQDYEKAHGWCEQAAENEFEPAQYELCFMYERGKGVQQDYEKARYWYEKAEKAEKETDNNEKDTFKFFLGEMYYKGEVVNKDYSKAIYWYDKASEQGNVNAQDMLCKMFEAKQGEPQDIEIAKKWYNKMHDKN